MQIKHVKAYPLRYPEPNDYNNLRHIVVVRVETDDGHIGWGEAVSMWPEANRAIKIIVEEGLAPLLLGRDPLDTYALWRLMKEHCWWYGEGGIASFAISALDIALWDLKGKALGVPLYKLLGGKIHNQLRACASTHPSKASIDDLAGELADHAANGYTAVKVGFGKTGQANLGTDDRRDVAYVQAVREAIGDEVDFMVDVGKKSRWDPAQAIQMVRAFERYNIRWIEDPLAPPTHFDGYRRLRAAIQTPIATGERAWTVEGYRQLITAGVGDIFLADPGRVEGITACHKIIELLSAANLCFNAHTWSSAINTAASIHLTATAPNYIVLELKPIPNPMQHELVRQPIEHRGGWVDVLEEPGLGIEVDESVVNKYLHD